MPISLPLNCVFGHIKFGQWGHLFCTKLFNTEVEINWAQGFVKYLKGRLAPGWKHVNKTIRERK